MLVDFEEVFVVYFEMLYIVVNEYMFLDVFVGVFLSGGIDLIFVVVNFDWLKIFMFGFDSGCDESDVVV